MKRIMILGASILQLPALIKAKDLGYHVIAVDADPEAAGRKFADEFLLISTIDTDKITEAATEKKIDGIMTLATDMPIRSVSVVAEKLNLSGVSVDTAVCTTDKYEMRKRLALHKVPIPEYSKVKDLKEYLDITGRFEDSFIVKPVDNSGSRGVYLVRTKNELEAAFFHAKKYSRNGEIIVEEYMKGREVSVETLSVNGKVHVLGITDKLTTGPPFFVEIGHSQPAQFEPYINDEIKRIASDAVTAVGIESGPSHTEIMVTDAGPKIVELGARLGGGSITSHLIPLSTGIDMVECCIKIAMKENPDFKAKYSKGSAIRFFRTYSGKIRSIEGTEKAKSIKGIREITLLKKEGDIINDLQCGSDRIGWVIAQDESVTGALSACEEALGFINITIDPFLR